MTALRVEALEAGYEPGLPIVQGASLVVVVLFVAVNLIVDLSYSAIDPRIRHDTAKPGAE